jgi:hypothetical protein
LNYNRRAHSRRLWFGPLVAVTAIDDGPQHMLIEQAAHVVAELSADR